MKQDPRRFSKLVCQFPNNSNPSYFNAVLSGIAESSVQIDIQIVFRVCLRCHQLPQKPCGRSISELFQKLAHLSWTPNALDIISHYALYDSSPEEELWRTKTSTGDIYSGGDILIAGFKSIFE